MSFPRAINVFVVSDASASDAPDGLPLGFAYVPGSDSQAAQGVVFVSWDSVSEGEAPFVPSCGSAAARGRGD